jgi:AraC-like DNA-binding protein
MEYRPIRFIVFGIIIVAMVGCTRQTSGRYSKYFPTPKQDSIIAFYKQNLLEGNSDTVANRLVEYYNQSISEKDSLSAYLYSLMAAETFLYEGKTDSCRYFLEKGKIFGEKFSYPNLKTMEYGIQAVYSIKAGISYSQALSNFYSAYNIARESRDTIQQVIELSNICNLFYKRSNKYGLKYAEEANKLVMEANLPPYYRFASSSALASMHIVCGQYQNARNELDESIGIAEQEGLEAYKSMIYLYYADLSILEGETAAADEWFEKAISYSNSSNSSTLIQLCLDYGNFHETKGDLRGATELYEKGLDLSSKVNDKEFYLDLLQGLANAYHKLGDIERSSHYFNLYYDTINSTDRINDENKFNDLLLSNQEKLYEYKIQDVENEIRHKRLIIIIAVSGLFMISIFFTWLLFMYRKQRKMYRVLVQQYNNYQLKLRQVKNQKEETDGNSKNLSQLFSVIESKMSEDKIFKRKDLSLDKLSEIIGTNRSYSSRAINTGAQMSFSKYLQMYRIREAASLISSSSQDVSFKQISDQVGYGSLSIFYKAFKDEIGCTPGQYRAEYLSICKETVPDS